MHEVAKHTSRKGPFRADGGPGAASPSPLTTTSASGENFLCVRLRKQAQPSLRGRNAARLGVNYRLLHGNAAHARLRGAGAAPKASALRGPTLQQ